MAFSNDGSILLAVVLQILGVGGVLTARFLDGKLATLACFALVGLLSLVMMRSYTEYWLAFATPLPLMAVAATIDFERGARVGT